MSKVYIGIDNGVSGTIGFTNLEGHKDYPHGYDCILTPVRKEQSYTKKKQQLNRVTVDNLIEMISVRLNGRKDVFAVIERPMINSLRFNASIIAARALEAELIVLEQLSIPFMYIDSKEWQRALLPSGIEGSEELKAASKDIGSRLFPVYKELFHKHKDADGMLISEYARRKGF